ncbi:MAG: PAS domain-containing protein [Pirellulales bacterium]|nr:PAS domain-containing protein [Pirellulales bacterium]
MTADHGTPSSAASSKLPQQQYHETQFRSLVENIPGVVYRCACDEHWTMEFISDTIEELSGYPANDFVENRVRSYASIIHPDDQPVVQQAVDESILDRTPYILDYRVIDADGRLHWVYEKGRGVFDDDGTLLWLDGAIFDVTDRRLAQERVRAEQQLLRQLLDLGERERKLLAYDIHDGFVQDVVGTKMMLEAMIAKDDLAGPEVKERLERLVETLAHAVDEGRRLISELRPLIIDEQGILAAIEYLVGESQSKKDSPRIKFEHKVEFERLPPLVESTVFRIVQETLNNIQRHSEAHNVLIRMQQLPGEILRIEITDDGVGFDQRNVPEDRFGLRGIVERARLFEGSASIESVPGEGTKVFVELPMVVSYG